MRGIIIPVVAIHFILGVLSSSAEGQNIYSEDFDAAENWGGGSAGSYNPKTYIDPGLPDNDQFSSNEAVRESSNVVSGYAWRLRNSGTPYFIYEMEEEVNSFSVYLAHWNLEIPMNVLIEYSINSGASYSLLQMVDENWWTDQGLDDKQYGQFNSGSLNISPSANEKIYLKISTDGNERLLIDNFELNYNNSSSGVQDPLVFYATAISENQIDLIFAPNDSNDDLVIAFNESGSFLYPSGPPPSVGQSFAGGTLFYTGTESPQSHVGLLPGQTIYYKAWSFDGEEYSAGLTSQETTTASLISPNAWINEIHYDNDGGDVNEFVEVVMENAAYYNLESITLSLYNGSNGEVYASEALNNFETGVNLNGYAVFYWPFSGIQNGAPEGMALDMDGVLIPGQFLSYEGTFIAVEGPALGLESTDIGIDEPAGTLEGQSLQLTGNGIEYDHFIWQGPMEDTPGEINISQELGGFTIWTGLVSNEWGSELNWTNGIPNINKDVLIPEIDLTLALFTVVSDQAASKDLILESNSVLEIGPAGSLTVSGNCLNDGSLIIRSDQTGTGSLIESNGVDATVERYISPIQWHYISSPISELYSDVFEGLFLMEWSEPDESWNYIEELGVLLNTGMYGYGLWSEGATILEFDGTLNAGSQFQNLTNTPGTIDPDNDPSGYNLVGNPFPSALDWDIDDGLGWTRSSTNTSMSIYFWNGSQYASYVKGGPNPGPNGGSNIIPPHQGFFVKCTAAAGGSIEVNDDARIHSNLGFYKNGKEDNQYARLQVSGNQFTDELILNVNPESGIEYDENYDACKLKGCIEAPQIFSYSSDSISLSINSFPFGNNPMTVKLGFEAADEAGIYEIKLLNHVGFDTIPILIEDRSNQVFTDLKSKGGYKFFASEGESIDHFWIHLFAGEIPMQLGEIQDFRVNFHVKNRTVFAIASRPVSGKFSVTDLMGREIISKVIQNEKECTVTIPEFTGIAVLELSTPFHSNTKKIFISD